MAEYQLEPINALGLSETVDIEIGLIRIVENNANSLASIAIRLGNEKKFSSSARKLLGFALPGPGEVQAQKPILLFGQHRTSGSWRHRKKVMPISHTFSRKNLQRWHPSQSRLVVGAGLTLREKR